MVLGHIDVTFVIEDLVKWLTWKITFSYTLVSNLWIGYLSRPVSRLESIQFQYFEHITLNLPLIIGTTFTPFYEVTICIWPNNKGLIDLLIILLGQINLPLLLGQSPLFMRSLFWWKLTKLNFFFRTKTPWVSHMRQTFCAWLQHESSLENTWSQSWKRKNRRSIGRITECNWLNSYF